MTRVLQHAVIFRVQCDDGDSLLFETGQRVTATKLCPAVDKELAGLISGGVKHGRSAQGRMTTLAGARQDDGL